MGTLDKFKTLKVVVGIPSTGMWHAEMALSLTNMLIHFAKYKIGQYKSQTAHVMHVKGSILPKSRWKMLEMVHQLDASHLLFIDTDQSFPEWTLNKLLEREKDVIGANVATKSIPSSPTARKKSDGVPYGDLVYTDPGMDGVEKVWRIGTGVLLISRKVIDQLDGQDLEIRWRPHDRMHQGEDWTMAEAIEKAGFDIWVDHAVSQEVGHIGYLEYNHSLVGEVIQMSKEAA